MYTEHSPIQYAARLLREGKVVGIPTETVYGLGACARTPEAIQKVYTIKGRPATNPLIIHLSHWAAISEWAIHIPDSAWTLAKHFWPGPLTLVLERHPSVPYLVTAQQDTVALRVPNHPVALALLEEFNSGIAAPSANRSGRISPTTVDHVYDELGDSVDYVLEGGPCAVGIESTIVYCKDADIRILRHGQITQENIAAVLNQPLTNNIPAPIIHVPGSNNSHYAPKNPLFLLESNRLFDTLSTPNFYSHIAVISFSKQPLSLHNTRSQEITWIYAKQDPVVYAKNLYAWLRTMDNQNPGCILVEAPPTTPEWIAITDRLQRAASQS